ncbi:hypothetical protein MPCS_01710 (plasmid) [Candidatus Megaera polyxenophila]|nr:hypothetical protein MPCS_01710 [Candidatus Megaera polyxenophila]
MKSEKLNILKLANYLLIQLGGVEAFIFQDITSVNSILIELKKYAENSQNIVTSWQKLFQRFVLSLDEQHFRNLVIHCPLEIANREVSELQYLNNITPFELAGLSCEEKKGSDYIRDKDVIYSHCWYDSDDFDAKCCHTQKGEICPVVVPPLLSNSGYVLNPQKIEVDRNRLNNDHRSIISSINAYFDPKKFSEKADKPISVGFLKQPNEFSKWNLLMQPQNLPIKFPFSNYRIPQELSQFMEAIQIVANYWHSINPQYADYYYCYFSVAQSEVPPGCFQRRGHLHTDGFQSHWLDVPLFTDFTFIVSDTASTEFYLQEFDISKLDTTVHNYFKYFAQNLKVRSLKLREPYEIVGMDAYTLHKSIRNSYSYHIKRTFIRIMYSVIRWPSQGNAYNPMFDYTWPIVKRDLLQQLL